MTRRPSTATFSFDSVFDSKIIPLNQSISRAGEITSRLSKDTDLMAKTVCLNVNVMLRTLIKTLGVIYFMLNLSWKLTFLVMMEVPLTGLVQNVYDKHYQVISGAGFS